MLEGWPSGQWQQTVNLPTYVYVGSNPTPSTTKNRFIMSFWNKASFLKSVAHLRDLPNSSRVEVAFIGRSNVGKSSLLNAILSKRIAKVSNTPGRTQMANYFGYEDRYLVDLPGYGYAKAPIETINKWMRFLGGYFEQRQPLRRIFLLVDARRGIGDLDMDLIRQCDKKGLSYQIVLTKMDKLNKTEIAHLTEQTKTIQSNLIACHPDIIFTSVKKNSGIDEIRQAITMIFDSSSI